MNEVLARLCLDHLHNEQAMLTTALSIVEAIQTAFGERGLDAFAAALGRHRELVDTIGDIQRRRRQFAQAVAVEVGVKAENVTMSAVLALLPEHRRAAVAEAIERARRIAHELTAANFVVSVHVRVHLDAYRRILRELTNTRDSSGRYGRAGRTESLEYRPMLQVQT